MPRKSSVGEQVGVSDLRVERCHPRSLRVFGESHSSIARLARVTGISATASSALAGTSPCTHQTRNPTLSSTPEMQAANAVDVVGLHLHLPRMLRSSAWTRTHE